ncbi:MAG TPA: shikimate dehydrogenase [Candidatus Limnocylindrales bacterium]
MLTRRAAVLGKPITHSLSPVIHNAGYQALGLDFTYTARECDEPELAGVVKELGEEWAGLSLTMPLKEVALTVAGSASEMATAIGAANTLVRKDGGWFAENTDVPGMVMALREAGVGRPASMAILGAGGTARAALGAAALLGTRRVVLFARRREVMEELEPVAERLGLSLSYIGWSGAGRCAMHDVVISTVPKGVADGLAPAWRPQTVVFDVVYDPWPTPLAEGARAQGCRIVSGLDLLLAQALGQFELFTGSPPPVEAMRTALFEAAAGR